MRQMQRVVIGVDPLRQAGCESFMIGEGVDEDVDQSGVHDGADP